MAVPLLASQIREVLPLAAQGWEAVPQVAVPKAGPDQVGVLLEGRAPQQGAPGVPEVRLRDPLEGLPFQTLQVAPQ